MCRDCRAEAHLRQAARQCHSANTVMHTMGPDMVPTVAVMEIHVSIETGVRSAVTGKIFHSYIVYTCRRLIVLSLIAGQAMGGGTRCKISVHGQAMTVLALKYPNLHLK